MGVVYIMVDHGSDEKNCIPVWLAPFAGPRPVQRAMRDVQGQAAELCGIRARSLGLELADSDDSPEPVDL